MTNQDLNMTNVLNIYEKIAALKLEVLPLVKDKENLFHKSSFFDINGLLESVEPLAAKHRLLIMQPIIAGYVVSKIIDLDSGEVDESSLKLPEINDPQKIGACITYYRRFTLQSQIGLQAEDDDGNKASGKGEKQDPSANTDNRPWLNQTQFNSALSRIKKKEAGVYDKIDKAFRISKAYRTQLKAA